MGKRKALPHPALSRWEKENRSQSAVNSCDGISRRRIGDLQNIRLLFPLPAGEGRRKGEYFLPHIDHRKSCIHSNFKTAVERLAKR